MRIGGLFIEDDLYAQIRARGEDVIPCYYCGKHLIPVRNVRSKNNYCQDCAQKVGRLSRYSSGTYHPNQEERALMVSRMSRAN